MPLQHDAPVPPGPAAPADRAAREADVLARLGSLPGQLGGATLDEEFRRATRQRLVAMAAVRPAGVRSPA